MASRINYVEKGAAARVRDEAHQRAAHVFVLSQPIESKDTFFSSARKALPLDPPLGNGSNKWDALEDSLWSGLDALEGDRIVVVWPRADLMRERALDDFEVVVGILDGIASALATKHAGGPPKHVEFFLEGLGAGDGTDVVSEGQP